jgi:hypothetical protein
MRARVPSFVILSLLGSLPVGPQVSRANAACTDYAGFPREIAAVDVPGAARDIVLDGTRAYVAASVAGLQILDVTDPAAMVVLGSVLTPGPALGVSVSGTHAYVAAGDSGLLVVDLSDSAAIVGRFETPGHALKVEIRNHLAYVADGQAGLIVLDVSDPHAPQLVGALDTPGYAYDVLVDDRYAYVADGVTGLLIIDILLPSSPRVVGQLDTPGYAQGLSLVGSIICLADGYDSGLCLIDVSDPLSPILTGLASISAEFVAVAARDGYAYVAAEYYGVFIFDISDPAAPFVTNYVQVGTETLGVAVEGTVAFLACSLFFSADAGAIRAIDVTNPGTPALGRCALPGSAQDLVLRGDHAFVACGLAGLQALDLTDPIAPRIVGSVSMPYWTWDVALSGDYACVANVAALRVIDIADPASPQLRGSFDPPGSVRGVDAREAYAFIGTYDGYDGYFRVVDISDPGLPTQVAALRLATSVDCVTLDGNYAYVGASNPGFIVVDVSDPVHPFVCGSATHVFQAVKIAVVGGYAYVTTVCGPLCILDISNPAAPQVVEEIYPAGGEGVHVANGIVYFGQYDGQFMAADVFNPLSARVIGHFMTPDMVPGVQAGDNHLFLAAGAYGLLVVPFQCDASSVPLASTPSSGPRIVAEPNPSRAGAEVRLYWPVDQEAQVRIFDPAGRMIRKVLAARGAGGGLELRWDGRDARGRVAAPGAYFVEASAGSLRSVARVIRMR